MTHINDLDPEIIYRILYLISGEPVEDIDRWKDKLTLLQVCTKWCNLFKSHVFSQGFVGIYSLKDSIDASINIKSCVYYADNDIICRSNLDIITGRDKCNCDCVSKLKIKISKFKHIGQYAHVLKKLLALGVGYWLDLSFLSFRTYCKNDPSLNPKDIKLEELSATVSKYICDFQNKAPNITHLDFNCHYDKILFSAFSILIDNYAQRLQHLCVDYLIKYPLPLFSTELTSLSLNLYRYTHRHLFFYAKPLQFLCLYSISSSNFSWRFFHDFTTPQCIEFTNLKTLILRYVNPQEKESKLYGSHILRFPKLESLTLKEPPVDCDVFFTDTIPTHLEKLDIQGDCDPVVVASKLRFTSVNKMHIEVDGYKTTNDDIYIVAYRYFGHTKIGSICEVAFGLPIDIQRTVSWVNVTNLRLGNIEFTNLLKLFLNLYKLQILRLGNISLSNECLSIIRAGLEEEEQGEVELLDNKIKHLMIFGIDPGNPHYFLAFLNHLLLRTTTLINVNTSDRIHSYVMKSSLPEKFQHINFIKDIDAFLGLQKP